MLHARKAATKDPKAKVVLSMSERKEMMTLEGRIRKIPTWSRGTFPMSKVRIQEWRIKEEFGR